MICGAYLVCGHFITGNPYPGPEAARVKDHEPFWAKEIRVMKKTVMGICMVFCVSTISATSFAGVDFVLDIKPASLLVSPDVDGFEVERSGYYWDTVEGTGSWMPTLKAGIGIDTSSLYIDVTGGLGYLWNDAFHANMYLADVAVRFKLGRVVTLGPHISVVSFDPTWEGELSDSDDVELSECTGFMPGLCLTAGGKIVSFSLSLDYLSASFDVETHNGWRANDDSLDMSGLSLNLGVLLRF